VKLKGAKVLVTGAGGFIGSHLLEDLVRRGCRVVGFVHYNSFNRFGWIDYLPPQVKAEIEVFTGDIRDPFGVKKAMKGTGVVFHLAALIGIPYSYHSPDVYVDTNLKGTLNVLQAARETGVRKLIHTSTSEVYGTAQFVPITEEHPINPQSPYAATKAGADFLALTFFRSFGLPVAVVRPFNTYGPRQSARAVIPTIIAQILSGGKGKIRLGSLRPTRDFTFVKDTVRGFIMAAESARSVGEVINLGSDYEISIADLLRKISELTGSPIQNVTDRGRMRPERSEVERLWADNAKARTLLRWKPSVPLEKGLSETIAWFSDPGTLAFYKADRYNI
jgi:NAD dependent epimerase/dehydratase